MPSKYFLAEQVLLKLQAGFLSTAANVKIFDIIPAIGQKANALLKAQYVTDILSADERIPNNLVMVTYPPVDVVALGNFKSKCALPATPISLPRNMGVFGVSIYEDFRQEIIPLQAGQYFFLKDLDLVNDLLGVCYEVSGNTLIFTRNIPLHGVTKVYVRLLIVDIDQYDNNTNLPIPKDLESVIIDEVYKIFAPIPETVRVSDNYQPQMKT